MRIILEADNGVRSCSMYIAVASGSRFETPESSGVSHFIEHILFKGTKRRTAREIAEEMDEIGGAVNAATGRENTCFYARCLREHSVKAFDILADMVTSPRLDPEDIETEKGVILEEISMTEDDGEEYCFDVFCENAWRDDMLGANILGTRETVRAMNESIIREHMSRFYVPERIVISICGSFDEDAMLSKCTEYFGSMKNTGNPLKVVSAVYRPCFTAKKKQLEQNQIILGFPSPDGSLEDDEALMLATILGASSSRLFQRLREELGLVYSVDTNLDAYIRNGIFTVSLGVSSKSEEKALAEAVKILSRFPSTVTERELARAKEQDIASFLMGLESVNARASRNGRRELMHGKVKSPEEVEAGVRAVTLDGVRRRAEQLLDFANVSLCAVGNVKAPGKYKQIIEESIKDD